MKIEKKMQVLHLITILDRSGSMRGSEQNVITSYNELVARQKSKIDMPCIVSLYLFDDRLEAVYEQVELDEVPDLTAETYVVRGMTALYDAVGTVVTKFKDHENVFFVVDTDGQENMSTEFSQPKIKSMIEEKTAGGWKFLFIGADLSADVVKTMSTSLGFMQSQTFAKSAGGYAMRSASVANSVEIYANSLKED